MKFFRFFLIFLIKQTVFISGKELIQLINDLNPYEIVIFIDNLLNISFVQVNLIENLLNYNPVVLIDLNKVNQMKENRPTEMLILKNPRASITFIILPSIESEISDILGNVIKKAPTSPRPKSLLFLPTKFSNQDRLKNILTNAWSLKFLDFSIVSTTSEKNHLFMTYNPFLNACIVKDLEDTNELFPDKLKNLHGYSLKTQAFNTPPFLVTKIENNKTVQVSGFVFTQLEYIAKKLNFKFQFLKDPPDDPAIKEIVKNLELDNINISPLGIMLVKDYQSRNISLGYPNKLAKLVVVVPIIKTHIIGVTAEMFMILLTFFIIFTIFYIFVQSLKYHSDYWNNFYIFGILLGIPIKKPEGRINKIVYLTIAILSIIFSNNYFSMLSDIKLHLIDQELKSYDDLRRLNIPIYVPIYYNVIKDANENEKDFFQETSVGFECYKVLIETNNASCVYTFLRAQYYTKTQLNSRGERVMKISDISFRHELEMFFYEKASPFAEKIEQSMRQIFESNIIALLESNANSKFQIIDSKQPRLADEILLKQIVLITLSIGYVLAFLFFVYETVHFNGTFKK